jgi:RTX calcium-binding nonapeptide repeat (4 copies)
MLRRVILMLTLAAIAVVVVLTVGAGGAPAAEGITIKTCKSGQVCKGTAGNDWIFGSRPNATTGSTGNDNIRPMGGNDYVFANGGADQVAHSYGDDRIFGGCGSDTVRGGFGSDRIYANMPVSWVTMLNLQGTCAYISAPTTQAEREQITALAEAVGDDVDDRVYDLVDCAWLGSRGDEGLDEGFGQDNDPTDTAVDDTVVDCSNRDDQAP